MSVRIETARPERINHFLPLTPPYLKPILLAVRDCGVGWATVQQRVGRFDLPLDRPTITIFGDDFHVALGPAGFHRKSVRRVLARCRLVGIVACEPLPVIYGSAAAAAVLGLNTAIVETRPEFEMQWLGLVKEAAPNAQLLIGSVEERGH